MQLCSNNFEPTASCKKNLSLSELLAYVDKLKIQKKTLLFIIAIKTEEYNNRTHFLQMLSKMLSYHFNSKTVIREGRVTQLAVDEIKNWLVSNVLLEVPEEMIVLFLMCRDSDITLTKETILAYFKIKNGAPEIFNDRDVDREELQKTLNMT
jgi:hypothetical protein